MIGQFFCLLKFDHGHHLSGSFLDKNDSKLLAYSYYLSINSNYEFFIHVVEKCSKYTIWYIILIQKRLKDMSLIKSFCLYIIFIIQPSGTALRVNVNIFALIFLKAVPEGCVLTFSLLFFNTSLISETHEIHTSWSKWCTEFIPVIYF